MCGHRRPGGAAQGWRHSIGELVTCPFRLGMWISAGSAIGFVFAPRFTRLVAATFAALTGSDVLQPASARAQQAAEARSTCTPAISSLD